MSHPHLRPEPALRARPGHLAALLALLALLSLGCGGGDATGPDAQSDVAGRYRSIRALAAVTCTPERPPAGGGTVILTAFADTVLVSIRQAGSRLNLTYPDFPGSPADTGSVTPDGTVTIGLKETFQEEPRTGNRTFFVDLTVTETLRRADGGARLTGSGTYVNVFHEGAASAPVFATCSRPATVEYTRIGD